MLHIDFHLLRQAAISNTTSTATAEWSKRRVWRTAVMLVAGLAALPVHALTLTELFEKPWRRSPTTGPPPPGSTPSPTAHREAETAKAHRG